MTTFKHQQLLARKTSTPEVWKSECEQSSRSVAHWQDRSRFHSTMRKGRQRVLKVDYAAWGALQQTVYHHQSVSSVDELKRAIAKAWQKLSRSSTKCRWMASSTRRLRVTFVRYIVCYSIRWRHFIFQRWFK